VAPQSKNSLKFNLISRISALFFKQNRLALGKKKDLECRILVHFVVDSRKNLQANLQALLQANLQAL